MRADLEAHGYDVFTINWAPYKFYAFPPFPIILKVLQKVRSDRATGVVIVPDWPTKTMVSVVDESPCCRQIFHTQGSEDAVPPSETGGTHASGEDAFDGLSNLGRKYENQGLTERASSLITNSWSERTRLTWLNGENIVGCSGVSAPGF